MKKTGARNFWQQLKGTILIYDEVYARKEKVTKPEEEKYIPIDIKQHVHDNDYDIGLKFVLASSKNFFSLFRQAFIDMDKYVFKSSPSVNSMYDKELISVNSRFELLKEVNLYAHTMNVIVETIKITDKLPQNVKDIAIIFALFHDFGKNINLLKEFNYDEKGKEQHHKVSANYAKHIMQDEMVDTKNNNTMTKDLIEMVYLVLGMHHEKDRKPNLFLNILIEADINARENELRGILLQRKIKKENKDNK